MKKYCILLITLLSLGVNARGQNKALLYDFSEIPQSLMVNPGVASDFQWYSGVPTLSQFSVQAGTSGITVADLFSNDGIPFGDKIRDKAVFGMSERDDLSGNFQLEVLNIGFRGKNPDRFYSIGAYTEGDAIGYWFKDYAIFAYEGNANRVGQEFDLGHLSTRGELLNVYHLGINQKLKSGMTVGIRGKIYSSIFDFNSARNKGSFITSEGQRNLLASSIDADLELRSSGVDALLKARDEGNLQSTLIKRGLFGGNLGLGVDVGFTYNVNEQTVISGSLLDLGFIYHRNNTVNYKLAGEITIEGIQIVLPEAITIPDQDFWQNLVDDIENIVPFEQNSDSYINFRPTKLYFSVRHGYGTQLSSRANCECGPNMRSNNRARAKYPNTYGGQLYMINRPRGPQMALSGFFLRRFGNALALKTTYTIDKYSFTNIGLGLNLQAGPVNLYVMADNLLGYRDLSDSKYASLQFGLNIISWGKN